MFTATKEELELANEVFTLNKTEASRILSTAAATDLFERSKLSQKVLKHIRQLSNTDDSGGMLTLRELAMALRLIGWAQAGQHLDAQLIEQRELEMYSFFSDGREG